MLTTIIIKSIAPVTFLILGFEVLMKLKFSCPCIAVWNQIIALCILCVPALSAQLMMPLFLRFQESHNNGGLAQQDNSEKYNNLINSIPPILWVCIFFIDGDYVACGFTYNVQNICDRDHSLSCLSWCSDGRNGTTLLLYTIPVIPISKVNTKYFYPTLQMSSFVRDETVVNSPKNISTEIIRNL